MRNFEKLINNPQKERKAILLEIDRLNSRLKQARNKLMQEVIDDEIILKLRPTVKGKLKSSKLN